MFTLMAVGWWTTSHPISIPRTTLNQILLKRLGSRVPCNHTVVWTEDGCLTSAKDSEVSEAMIVQVIVLCHSSITFFSVLFQTKDLGLWYLRARHQQMDVTEPSPPSMSLCMLQRLCCTNRLIPFGFKCLSFVTLTGCWPFSVALLRFEVYLWLILAINCFALLWLEKVSGYENMYMSPGLFLRCMVDDNRTYMMICDPDLSPLATLL